MFLLAARWKWVSCAGFLLRVLWVYASVGGSTLPGAYGGDASKFSYDVWQVEEASVPALSGLLGNVGA